MAKFKPTGVVGPTRDWSDPMNLLIMAMVDKGYEDPNLSDEFTHVYVGGVRDAAKDIDLGGVSPDSVHRRLRNIGYIEVVGKEQKYQGRTIWHVRNELVSKEDASRADSLERKRGREGRKKSKPKFEKPVRYEVKQDELHPGNQVVKKANGPGELERALRESRILEEENIKLTAQIEDWKDEAEKLKEKLDKANVTELTERNARLETMVSQLLAGGKRADELREAAKLANPSNPST